jgi:hypothetical protein
VVGSFLDHRKACNFVGGEAENHSVGEACSCENGVMGKLGAGVVGYPLCFVYLVRDLC